MTALRLEVSNPEFTPKDTQFVTVYSSNTGRRHDISIYNAHLIAENAPVVLLLHGVYGNHWVWMNLGGVHTVYDQLKQQGLSDFVLVMPSDGGVLEGSAYLPLSNGEDYDRWIVEDVRLAVEQTVSAVSKESNWYITGLSMGGYGALRLGAKYPSLFKGISGHSSVTCLEDLKFFTEVSLHQYQEKNDELESNIVYWCKKHVAELTPMRFDCGQHDELFESNNLLAKRLTQANITFSYEKHYGGHEWAYWHKHIATTLQFFDQIQRQS
ncbi:alpha/beta hydrolase [Thalassotalea agarivorans]|uniref:S-formylglutathione hydrolase FrmB n=1 Tax=Thalassotalea agarivorans TaxID=349064 RepID=A0A1I0DZA6_THASX|nr:alpha/beta fold hydrolase [Thalassotalea agarivorans]SET38038.1 S-formylglutathione hydrolase FrmB [Thalassotalea agarivorans]